MPSVEIKAAVIALLNASFGAAGDNRLPTVLTQYPQQGTLGMPAQLPRAVVWATRHPVQTIPAAGRAAANHSGPSSPIGLRSTVWTISIHVKTLFNDALAATNNGDTYDQLIDDIETM